MSSLIRAPTRGCDGRVCVMYWSSKFWIFGRSHFFSGCNTTLSHRDGCKEEEHQKLFRVEQRARHRLIPHGERAEQSFL